MIKRGCQFTSMNNAKNGRIIMKANDNNCYHLKKVLPNLSFYFLIMKSVHLMKLADLWYMYNTI